jgi:hypothetical protein
MGQHAGSNGKVFPDRKIEPINASHPIFHSFFDLNPSDMVAPYFNESESGRSVSCDLRRQGTHPGDDRLQQRYQRILAALDVGQCSITNPAVRFS